MEEKKMETNDTQEMSKEKRKTIVFTIILAIIALALITVFTVDKLKEEGIIASAESKEILNKFDEYFNSKDTKVIYYASSNCDYCELQTPVLESIASDYDLDYYYIDSSKLSKGQKRKITNKLGIESKTPTTVVVENGKVIDVNVGYVSGHDCVEFLKSAKALPKDAVYEDEKYITFIDYSEYEELINKNDTSIIVVGQTACQHCIAIKPALNSVAHDYNITINYLNLTDLSDDENGSFFESLKKLEYDDEEFVKEGSIGTPLTIIVKNGKISDYFSGEKTTSQLVREYKKLGLISE